MRQHSWIQKITSEGGGPDVFLPTSQGVQLLFKGGGGGGGGCIPVFLRKPLAIYVF